MADVVMFGPGKCSWTKEVQRWKLNSGNRELTMVDLVKILKIVIDKTMRPEHIRKGFHVTGTFPLDSANVMLDRCIGAEPQNNTLNAPGPCVIISDELICEAENSGVVETDE
jgi:hypothetical protein